VSIGNNVRADRRCGFKACGLQAGTHTRSHHLEHLWGTFMGLGWVICGTKVLETGCNGTSVRPGSWLPTDLLSSATRVSGTTPKMTGCWEAGFWLKAGSGSERARSIHQTDLLSRASCVSGTTFEMTG